MQEGLDREKKVRADVEKAKRKVETDLKATQESVEELDRIKHELEDAIRKYVDETLDSDARTFNSSLFVWKLLTSTSLLSEL